jgi:hypothetical protein
MRTVALLAVALALALAACSPQAASPSRAGAAEPKAASTLAPECAAPNGREPPILLDGATLLVLCHGLYADRKTTIEQRESLKRWYGESLRGLATFFGAAKREEPPIAISCNSDACALHFTGPTRRSKAFIDPRPMVVINGIGSLTKGTMLHELIHVEIARRMRKTGAAGVPAWFDEGVATFVGDNAPCPAGTKRAIDDLRRLDAQYAWQGFTELAGKIEPAYCQARDEIGAWAARHGRAALVDVIDAVAAGRSFDEVYGPLVTSIAPEAFDRSLDGRFPLDENVGTSAVDQSGRSHVASLIGGAVWTIGHRGAGVKVASGSYVRADGFVDFGVPDAPFSISFWEKPLANAKVVVHTSRNASGSDGWCVPLVGHDTSGHLVAQVNFANDEKAFIAATGPVPALNTWTHVVTTWSTADGLRLYVNGALAASTQPRSPAERHRTAPASPVYLSFGSNNDAQCWNHAIEPGSWNGVLDEIRVYNYALTPEQVATDMRGP